MKKLLILGLLFASPAFAADNAVIVTPGTGVTMKSKDIGAGVQAMQPVLSDTGGNALSTPTAGADAVSNTSTGLLAYSRNLVWNGTTWDRWTGDLTSGAWVNVKASALPSGGSTSANQTTINTSVGTTNTNLGAPGATACASDTASCSVNQLMQRVAQNLSTLNTTAGGAVPAGTNTIGSVGFDPSLKSPLSVPINVSTATTTQLVALSGATLIYVTSFDVIAGGTGNITFVYGTGSSCGTGTTSLTGAYPLVAQAGISKGSGVATVLKVPSGNALCVTTSAAVQMSGSVSYMQF